MDKQKLAEFYKNNKTVAIGVPFIIFILLLDLFVLRPARIAKKQENMPKTATAQPAASQAAAPVTGKPQEVKPPAPIKPVKYPALSPDVDTRFSGTITYPYSRGRNVFLPIEDKRSIEVVQVEETAEVVQRPELSYHGFFTVDNDRVAILKTADELLMTRVGNILLRTPFKLMSVAADHIIIADTANDDRHFEVVLSDRNQAE